MPTKLSRLAEGVMEAAWLGAVMLVPAFFNIYSSRIFEPDKITLLRTLALLMLAAWLVKLFEEGGARWERIPRQGGRLRSLLRLPLAGLVVALALIYLVATVFSITPFTSFWGSYQRLQGTYTTFSYLVVFVALVANLRKQGQVERLISVAIFTSLPISLYGILQRYQADPIPWGGDVTGRIASNMGNSIFVAAYLVMVLPPTIMRVVESFEALLTDRGSLWPNFARSTVHIFILALQVIAIFFSGSRGPWLGMGASLIILWLGLSLVWRKRWLTLSGVTIAILAGAFLVLLNIPNGPLESLRGRPEFGRLGQLLDAESRTGRVRTLIWQGASELVLPHEPLEYPDGRQDPFNFLRPLIGYGPESMYVAYNRFYPPELTQVEKRNATPDRAHNETWDSLVITGVLGLAVYLALFGSLFYYGLKWLGLVPGKRERNLYLALYLLGGAISTFGFVAWGGIKFLGVALPFGMVMGVVVYMILISLFGRVPPAGSYRQSLRLYLLLGLLAAVVAHFVEINFGIAIAATRITFWVYAALILLVGYVLPLHEEGLLPASAKEAQPEPQAGAAPERSRPARSGHTAQRRRPAGRRAAAQRPGWLSQDWLRQALFVGLISGLLLATLGYEFISNASRAPTAFGLVWASLMEPAREGSRNGILPLMLTTWLAGAILFSSESGKTGGDTPTVRTWLKTIALGAAIAILIAFVFWLWDAAGLAALGRTEAQSMEEILGQVRDSEGLLTVFYVQVFAILFGLAFVLPGDFSGSAARFGALSTALALFLVAAVLGLSSYSNLRVIQADIAFKTGDLFARPDGWPAAISIYNRANSLAPNEDYYYLFLGRAYLEYAKTLQDTPERENLITQAERDLLKAQEINPLNTDHTANLARLYSLWATFTQDPALRQRRATSSEEYFRKALVLSPNNSRLWDEWAVLYLSVFNEPQRANELLEKSLEIDPYYDWTFALLGDYYSQDVAAGLADQPEKKAEALKTAAGFYAQAIEKGEGIASAQMLYNYSIALGGVSAQLEDFPGAILSYERALAVLPGSSDAWRVQIALAQLYARQGDLARAREYANTALTTAPAEQQQAILELIAQMTGTP